MSPVVHCHLTETYQSRFLTMTSKPSIVGQFRQRTASFSLLPLSQIYCISRNPFGHATAPKCRFQVTFSEEVFSILKFDAVWRLAIYFAAMAINGDLPISTSPTTSALPYPGESLQVKRTVHLRAGLHRGCAKLRWSKQRFSHLR